MAEKEKSGDKMGEYLVKVDSFNCLWCKKKIDFSSVKGASVQHSGSKSYKAVAATSPIERQASGQNRVHLPCSENTVCYDKTPYGHSQRDEKVQ